MNLIHTIIENADQRDSICGYGIRNMNTIAVLKLVKLIHTTQKNTDETGRKTRIP